MRKVFSIALLLALSVAVLAQKDVTKFLGIPVDGTKLEMKQKLINKGFTYNSRDDVFEGEFNGSDVTVSIATNKNKVWRIMVLDANPCDEGDIKIRFNNLCRQFEKNKKYMSASGEDYTIPDDESISYEMIVNHKKYQAAYLQDIDITLLDTLAYQQKLKELLLQDYTQEQIDNPTKKQKEEMAYKAVQYALDISIDIAKHKSVWFTIIEKYGRYFIAIYYDNEYNHSDGEDL